MNSVKVLVLINNMARSIKNAVCYYVECRIASTKIV